MHTLSIPQSVVDRVIARRGREHIYENLDPTKTALVVVDMQNAFMLPEVAHALCPMAEKIVPNINRLARVVREMSAEQVLKVGENAKHYAAHQKAYRSKLRRLD